MANCVKLSRSRKVHNSSGSILQTHWQYILFSQTCSNLEKNNRIRIFIIKNLIKELNIYLHFIEILFPQFVFPNCVVNVWNFNFL